MSVFHALLRRKKLYIVQETTQRPKNVIAIFLMELSNLGFMVDETAYTAIHFLRDETLKEILDGLKEMVGQREYKAFYPNFPKQVMDASDAELFLNAIIHYYSFAIADLLCEPGFIWLPKYDKVERKPLDEKVKLTRLSLVNNIGAMDLLNDLVMSNSSLSATDKTDLAELIYHFRGDYKIPDKIPQKETAAVVGATLLKCNQPINFSITSTNDILRIACAYCNGDVSLAADTEFTKIPRSVRRSLLEKINSHPSAEDMLLHKGKWLRLGEALHPGEYRSRFPKAYECFRIIREEKVRTFNSKVEKLILDKDKDVVDILLERPGYFARRLDEVLRMLEDKRKNTVIRKFASVVDQVSTPVLLQVSKHFAGRNKFGQRLFMPKGNAAKIHTGEVKGVIPENFTKKIETHCLNALTKRFAKMPSLGQCYIDPILKNYLVPFSQRSASKSLHTIVRGSQIPLEDKNTIRFFIWWKQPKDQIVDLDLSSLLLDENFKTIETIAFYNLRSKEGCHSGDVTSAPNGACEFIDLNLEAYAKRGRYVLMCVYNYTNSKFADLPECFAGWMMREKPQSGEIFDARTVQNKIDVTSGSRNVNPLIIDLHEKKVIWTDLTLNSRAYGNTVAGSLNQLQIVCQAMTKMIDMKWNLYDLIKLHVESRGKLVSKEKAKTVFGEELAYQPEVIMSQFLV